MTLYTEHTQARWCGDSRGGWGESGHCSHVARTDRGGGRDVKTVLTDMMGRGGQARRGSLLNPSLEIREGGWSGLEVAG